MSAFEVRIPRRLLCLGIILLSAAAMAGPSDIDELGLTADAITTIASIDSTSAPSSLSDHQSDGVPKHRNHTTSASGGDDAQVSMCPSGLQCSKLGGECINCTFNYTCVYGQEVVVMCSANQGVNCTHNAPFQVSMVCRYCYQVESWEQTCQPFDRQRHCKSGNTQREKERYKTNCTAKSNVVCLGNRTFPRYLACNWTAGYKWTTALVLSITLGGFGADRFYLGHWQEGIGKLFSFGGLGVWTLLDVILIAVGYLGPADGSLYIW